jgi:NTP pyrophosphatase (non-canonical NTP hydrolase)
MEISSIINDYEAFDKEFRNFFDSIDNEIDLILIKLHAAKKRISKPKTKYDLKQIKQELKDLMGFLGLHIKTYAEILRNNVEIDNWMKYKRVLERKKLELKGLHKLYQKTKEIKKLFFDDY